MILQFSKKTKTKKFFNKIWRKKKILIFSYKKNNHLFCVSCKKKFGLREKHISSTELFHIYCTVIDYVDIIFTSFISKYISTTYLPTLITLSLLTFDDNGWFFPLICLLLLFWFVIYIFKMQLFSYYS
jgi:ABC-type transport system involved in cytochrome bd biosynthesis fused ATPase/permease subunit